MYPPTPWCTVPVANSRTYQTDLMDARHAQQLSAFKTASTRTPYHPIGERVRLVDAAMPSPSDKPRRQNTLVEQP